VSDHVRSAIITGAVGAGVVIAVRVAMRVAFRSYLARAGTRRSASEIAGQRTRFVILGRLVTVILSAIVAWSVLQEFPSTDALARSLLASGAVLTVFVGIALSGPLSNIGAGVLLGLSQAVRLGDRVTIGDVTGTAVEITLMHTILHSDEGRRVFVPNSQMASSIVTNRSIDDPRRLVSVRVPIALGAAIDRARAAIVAAVDELEGCTGTLTVTVVELTDRTAWLAVSGHLAPDSDVASVAAGLRERALRALADAQLLPG
jgi:small-conductance mechanosensitive channel